MNNLLEAVPSGSVTPDDLLRMGSKGKQFELVAGELRAWDKAIFRAMWPVRYSSTFVVTSPIVSSAGRRPPRLHFGVSGTPAEFGARVPPSIASTD